MTGVKKTSQLKPLFLLVLATLMSGLLIACSPPSRIKEPSDGHLGLQKPLPVEPAKETAAIIPPRVKQSLILPEPKASEPLEKFTVIVNEVPTKELLFALARDAKMNLDIYDDIDGFITLNAIDQTLPQILDRVGKQSNIRYEIKDGSISVSADTPYLRTYKVDYVNLARKTSSTLQLSTQIADVEIGEGGSGGGSNNSNVNVENTSDNAFWTTLFQNVSAIVGTKGNSKDLVNESVIVNRETGLLTVRASQAQHREVQSFLDKVMDSSRRQVLIEATIVEVNLSDEFQSGIDWSRNPLAANINPVTGSPIDDFSISQQLIGGTLGNAPRGVFELNNLGSDFDVNIAVRLLSQFGDTRVLSSPKMMALNNQTAILKVVDNRVYFTVEADTVLSDGGSSITTFETDVHTVPVGLVMSITPYISDADEITLNVRPTISRILGFVNDPNPSLATAGVTSPIPEIQVREMESVLRLNDGQIGVIGGLMEDRTQKETNAIPGISNVSVIGEAFKAKDNEQTKTELVILIQPTVVQTPSIDADLKHLRTYLPKNSNVSKAFKK